MGFNKSNNNPIHKISFVTKLKNQITQIEARLLILEYLQIQDNINSKNALLHSLLAESKSVNAISLAREQAELYYLRNKEYVDAQLHISDHSEVENEELVEDEIVL